MSFGKKGRRITITHLRKPIQYGLAGMVPGILFTQTIPLVIDDHANDSFAYDFACLAYSVDIDAVRILMDENIFYGFKRGEAMSRTVLFHELGHYYKVLVPVLKANDETIYLYCKGFVASAKGFVSAGGFTVLEGSTVSDHTVSSLETKGKSYYNLRNTLIKDGTVSDRVFTRDMSLRRHRRRLLSFWGIHPTAMLIGKPKKGLSSKI